MGADEVIDSLVDRSKVKGDIDFVTDLLKNVFDNIEKINNSKISITAAKGMAETARAAEDAAKAVDDLAKSSKKVKQTNDEIEKSLQGVKREWLSNAAEMKENIALQVQYEAELKKVKTLLASAEQSGNTTKIVEYRAKALELKAAISELDRTTKYQAQSNNVLEGTFTSMSLELGNLKTLYKRLVDEEKKSPWGLALKKSIDLLEPEVKKMDAELGNFQRNVGNYKSGFNGLGMSINQMLRELPAFTFSIQTGLLGLSNNFPMLFDEIAKTTAQVKKLRAEGQQVPGAFAQIVKKLFTLQSALSVGVLLLTLYGDKAIKWAGALFSGSEKMNEVAETQRILNAAMDKGNNSYVEAASAVNQLRSNIELANKGLINKKDVLKEYNDGIGKTIGQVDNLRKAEEKLMKHGDAYIQFMLLKAAAQLASDEAAKKMLEVAKVREKEMSEFTTVGDQMMEGLGRGFGNQLVPGAGDFQNTISEVNRKLSASKRKEEEAKVLEDEKSVLENIFKSLKTRAAELGKEHGFNFLGTDGDGKNTKEKIFKDGDDIRKALYETQKATLEETVRTNDNIVKDEKQSFLLRVKAAKEYLAAKLALNKQEYDYKNEDIDAKEKEDIKQAERDYKNEEEKNKRIDYIKKAAAANRLLVEKEYGIGEQKIKDDYYNAYLGQLQQYLIADKKKREEHEKDLMDIELDRAETKYIQSTTTLDARYAKEIAAAKSNVKRKEKIEREYQRESARLLRDYNIEVLAITIREGKKQIEAAEEVAKATGNEEDWARLAAAREKIAQLEVKLAKYVAEAKKKANKDTSDDNAEQDKEMDDRLKYYSGQAIGTFSSVGDIINARYEKEKNRIEQQIELIEKKKQADIDAINAGADSEERKAAKIKLIEAQAQNQREMLERRQRMMDQKKARFQKAVSIVTIIQETAIAVMKAYQDYGIAGAVAAGAMGAAKLAAVIATPIPQYKYGSQDHKGGLAVVGDGGKREIIETPSGNSYITPDRPTLVSMPQHSKVLPDAKEAMNAVNMRARARMPIMIVTNSRGDNDRMIEVLGGGLDKLTDVVKSKEPVQINATRAGLSSIHKEYNNFWQYIGVNIR